MNFKKNVKKAGAGLLISALAIGSAFAFLANSDTAQKQNNIKIGSIKVIFKDGTNAITLTENGAIPMSGDYALKNLTPYTFKVANQGEVDVKYNIRMVTEDGSTIDPSLVEVLLNPTSITTDENGTHYTNIDSFNPWVKLSDVNLVNKVILDSGEETDNVLFARIVETAENADVLGKQISFHLELEAEQNNGVVLLATRLLPGYRLRVSAEEFKNASNSDFTSFKVNGEEFVGRDINTEAGFMFNWVRGEIGSDTSVPPVDGGDVVRPTAWLNGTNTFSFVFKGKEYSGTFEFDATPAYKIVTWADENHNTLKQVKYSMDNVELEVLQDGDISTATTKRTETYNADGSYRFSSSSENL